MATPAPPADPVDVSRYMIISKWIRKHVIRVRVEWNTRKKVLFCEKRLLERRGANEPDSDSRTTGQIAYRVDTLQLECDVMQWEIRYLTHVYNARSGKATHITAAENAMAKLHELRVESLGTITDADLSNNTKLTVVIQSPEGEKTVFKNGGGVKAIADRYMAKYKWELDILALCRAGKYT